MTRSTVHLREATGADLEAVLALWQTQDVATSTTDDADGLRLVVEHPTSSILVADDRGRIVASLIAAWDGWRGSLYRLAVMPEHRRAGLATELVREGERHLREHGARRISVLVLDEADAAKAFWRSVGYEFHEGISRAVRSTDEAPRELAPLRPHAVPNRG